MNREAEQCKGSCRKRAHHPDIHDGYPGSGCICWDGNPNDYQGPHPDCPIYGENGEDPR